MHATHAHTGRWMEIRRCVLCETVQRLLLYTSLSLASLWCSQENVTRRRCVSPLSYCRTHERDNLLSLTPLHKMPTGFHSYLVAGVQPPRWPFQTLCVVQQMCSLKTNRGKRENIQEKELWNYLQRWFKHKKKGRLWQKCIYHLASIKVKHWFEKI